jgi:hypothetical protein
MTSFVWCNQSGFQSTRSELVYNQPKKDTRRGSCAEGAVEGAAQREATMAAPARSARRDQQRDGWAARTSREEDDRLPLRADGRLVFLREPVVRRPADGGRRPCRGKPGRARQHEDDRASLCARQQEDVGRARQQEEGLHAAGRRPARGSRKTTCARQREGLRAAAGRRPVARGSRGRWRRRPSERERGVPAR